MTNLVAESKLGFMELEQAAKQLEALGNKTRLTIYRDLVQAGRQGNTVGEINERLDIPPSTLSHHIAKLVQTGLVSQERVSRNLVCSADFENMESLIMFLANNCCADDSSIWG